MLWRRSWRAPRARHRLPPWGSYNAWSWRSTGDAVSEEGAGRPGDPQDSSTADSRPEIAAPQIAAWLGDVIPVPAPWRPEVVSPGDVAVAAGLAQLVLLGMRPQTALRGRHGRRVQPWL